MISCISLIPAQKNLAIQMNWRHKCGGRRERWRRGNRLEEGNPFQKLSLWEECSGAGRGGAQAWLFLNWNAEPFGPLSSFSQALRTTCQRHKSPRQFILSAFSLQKHGLFPQNLQPSFPKLFSIRVQVSPPKWCCSGRDPGGKRKENSQGFGVEVESWHTGANKAPVLRGNN